MQMKSFLDRATGLSGYGSGALLDKAEGLAGYGCGAFWKWVLGNPFGALCAWLGGPYKPQAVPEAAQGLLKRVA